MDDKRPIAVFDSGVGGISVLKELTRLMPNENYIYFGDSENAPYGTKPVPLVRELAVSNVERLVTLGAKAVVIACNTATSVAVDYLREEFPNLPIIGVEPALKPAVLHKENSVIAVMATPITLHEEKFARLMQHYSSMAKIISVSCDKLAEYIENGVLSGSELESYIRGLLLPLGHIDSVVLGCTHYPFVKPVIGKIVGEDTAFFDGGEGTARETRRRITECGIVKLDEKKGKITFLNSKNSPEEEKFSRKLFEI